MAKWPSQTLSYESVTDKQRKQKIKLPRGVRSPSPTKRGMVIEEVRTTLARLKRSRIRHSFAARGAENLGQNAPPKFKSHSLSQVIMAARQHALAYGHVDPY